jgi:hypothetical protein
VVTGTGVGAGVGAVAEVINEPQDLQNLAVRLFSVWHLAQLALLGGASTATTLTAAAFKLCPQPLQNFALSLFSVAHFGQVTAMFFPQPVCLFLTLTNL